jgi:acyl-CoA thioesterase-1
LTRIVNVFARFAIVFAAVIVLAIMAVLRPAAGEPLRILALGDSLTAGYGLAAAEAFPARLEAALRQKGHDVVVVNAGVSGDTTAGGRARIGWSLGGTPRPDAVIVALGSNDALRGLEPAETWANLEAILGEIRKAGLPALLAGMKAPRNLGPDYVREFEAVFPAAAKRYDALHYPFFLEGVALVASLNQADGIHPNEKGVARMVAGLLPLVEQLIARARRSAR